jgi:hypothetical protein
MTLEETITYIIWKADANDSLSFITDKFSILKANMKICMNAMHKTTDPEKQLYIFCL